MAWDDWLTITETLESELYLNVQARMIFEIKDMDYLQEVAINYQRQNWEKDEVIKNCIEKIGDLESELIKISLAQERLEKKKINCITSRIKKVFHRKN
tara:strand:- start:740 stop:1033 length:294 start_codon:yes stop_codon:yes gene_type:complete